MHGNHEEDLAILTMIPAMVTGLIEQVCIPGGSVDRGRHAQGCCLY